MSSLSSHHLFDDGFHYIIQTARRGEGEAERRVIERGKGGREIEDGEIERVKEGVWVRREGQKMDRMEGDRKREKKERGRGEERTREQRRRRPLRRLYQLLLANTHTQTHETHKPNTHTNIYKHQNTNTHFPQPLRYLTFCSHSVLFSVALSRTSSFLWSQEGRVWPPPPSGWPGPGSGAGGESLWRELVTRKSLRGEQWSTSGSRKV